MSLQIWIWIIVGLTFALYIGIAIWSKAGSTNEFYIAGKGVNPIANGMATAADWMSAASFISMAGIISFIGYDGSVYLMGWTGGYVLLALLLAPYLRKFGKFTDNYWKFETNQTFIENLDLTRVQKHQFFDYYNWLPNNLLVKLDRCLMSYGMEGRTPLIDKKLFENFFFIKDEYKINNSFGKFMIRNFIKSRVKHYDAFTKKEGFTIPIEKWLPKHSKFFLEFLPKIEILRIFFNQDEIKELCKSITHNKKAIRCVWHMIFISTWYYVTFNNVKTDGNFFDIISS